MATKDEVQQKITNIENNLRHLLEFNIDNLFEDDVAFQETQLKQNKSTIKKNQAFFSQFDAVDLSQLALTPLNEIDTSLSTTLTNFNNLKTLLEKSTGNVNKTDFYDLVGKLEDNYDTYFKRLLSYITYLKLNNTDFSRLSGEYNLGLQELHRIIDDTKSQATKQLNEGQNHLSFLKELVQNAGVSQNAIHFKEEANANADSAKNWLWATAAMTLIFLGIGIFFFIDALNYTFKPEEYYKLIQISLTKIVVLSFLSYVIIWCGRNYRAYRHNYVVNKHRQNGLSTFEALVKGTTDEQIKNAVLMKATESIFSPAPSGFNHEDKEQSHSTDMFDIMKKMVDAKTGGK